MVERRDDDAAVWRRAKDEMSQGEMAQGDMALNGSFARPDPLTLAAFLEGHAGEVERREVEAWLAVDPEAPALLQALRSPVEAEAVPQAVLTRAQDIVRPQAKPTRKPGGGWLSGLGGFFAGAGLQWAAVAVVMLVVAASGFEIGRSGGAALAEGSTTASLSSDFDTIDDALL